MNSSRLFHGVPQSTSLVFKRTHSLKLYFCGLHVILIMKETINQYYFFLALRFISFNVPVCRRRKYLLYFLQNGGDAIFVCILRRRRRKKDRKTIIYSPTPFLLISKWIFIKATISHSSRPSYEHGPILKILRERGRQSKLCVDQRTTPIRRK